MMKDKREKTKDKRNRMEANKEDDTRLMGMGDNIWADDDVFLSREDNSLFERIGEFIRAEEDIDDIKNDPLYSEISGSAKVLISEFINNKDRDLLNSSYIKNSLEPGNENEQLEEEIRSIQNESREKDIDRIAAEWVKEHGTSTNTEKKREISDFIKSSLEKEVPDSGKNNIKHLRWIITAAAVLTGAVILIRTLLPSGDPDRLFTKYYESMNAISTVTRGGNTEVQDIYNSAIESYNNLNFQAAAAGFSVAVERNSKDIASRFFLGISHLALGNYEQAAGFLQSVVNEQGQYLKEATWYLGLTYLKTGETEKASACFRNLTGSPGFYQDRAEKILHRIR